MRYHPGNGSTSPTVEHIASVIAQRIQTGVYKNGQRLPSERLFAEEFHVSRIIIRSVIKEIERAGLVICSARCRPVVRSGGLTPAPARANKRRNLALWIWPSPAWPASSMIIHGIRQALNQDDFRLVFESAFGETWDEILHSEAEFLERIAHDRDIEGIVLWYLGSHGNLAALKALREAQIPMVFLDRRPPAGFEADYVGVDNMRAVEHLMKHLLSLGHRSIAHVTNYDTAASTMIERFNGYRRALDKAGIPFRPELVQQDAGPTGEHDSEGCLEALDRLLGLPDPPTAILAINDNVALRVIAALRARGLRIPEEMAVAGFDGLERWSPGLPYLTTMSQPFERMGMQAVELLLERLASGPSAPFKHIVLEARLIVSETTRPALQSLALPSPRR